jgi:hypothetical protein
MAGLPGTKNETAPGRLPNYWLYILFLSMNPDIPDNRGAGAPGAGARRAYPYR